MNAQIGLFVILAVFFSMVCLVGFALVRMRRLRNELDDQGIKLIQLTNLSVEQKKEIAALQSTLNSVVDHIERTNVRKGMLPDNAGSHAAPHVDTEEGAPTTVRFDAKNDSKGDGGGKRRGKGKGAEAAEIEQVASARAAEAQPTAQPTNVQFAGDDNEVTGSRDLDDDTNEDTKRLQQMRQQATQFEYKVDSAEPAAADDANRPGEKSARGKEVQLMREFSQLQEFINEVGSNVTKVGIFLPSETLLPVGTRVEMDLRLKDKTPLICGKGEVKRVHHANGGTKRNQQGMDIRFIYIDPASKEMIRRIVANSEP